MSAHIKLYRMLSFFALDVLHFYFIFCLLLVLLCFSVFDKVVLVCVVSFCVVLLASSVEC